MFCWITSNLIWTEGRYILLLAVLISIIGLFFSKALFFLSILFILWSFYFFRNPPRTCIPACDDEQIIVCPADGRVVEILHEPNNSIEGSYTYRISIFLSAFDVHVNRSPIAGRVESVKYTPGAFKLAFLPKSSLLNEHNDIIIERDSGQTILVRQIAGFVARRIRCWVSKEEQLSVGQRYGMIKFGSRVDIFLPSSVRIDLEQGQYVYGGQTVLGRWI